MQEKMNSIQLGIESGDKNKNIDPFCEVITKERGGRVFLQGKGVTRSSLKDKGKMEGYIVDQNFFENMKAKWIQEVTPALASTIMSQLQNANPHMNLVIPDFTCASTNSNQLSSEQVLHSDTETRPSPQVIIFLRTSINSNSNQLSSFGISYYVGMFSCTLV